MLTSTRLNEFLLWVTSLKARKFNVVNISSAYFEYLSPFPTVIDWIFWVLSDRELCLVYRPFMFIMVFRRIAASAGCI